MWNNNIRAGNYLKSYSLCEFPSFTQARKVFSYVITSDTAISTYGGIDSSGKVFAHFPVGLATGLVYNRDQWGWHNEQFYEVLITDFTQTIKRKFWVLASDVSLFENEGLANQSSVSHCSAPKSNTAIWFIGKLHDAMNDGKLSLSGIPKPQQKSILGLSLFGM